VSEHVRRKGFSVRALREPDGEGSGEEGVIGEGGGGGGGGGVGVGMRNSR